MEAKVQRSMSDIINKLLALVPLFGTMGKYDGGKYEGDAAIGLDSTRPSGVSFLRPNRQRRSTTGSILMA